MWGTHLSNRNYCLYPLEHKNTHVLCLSVCVHQFKKKLDAEPSCVGFRDAFLLVLKLASVSEVIMFLDVSLRDESCSWGSQESFELHSKSFSIVSWDKTISCKLILVMMNLCIMKKGLEFHGILWSDTPCRIMHK